MKTTTLFFILLTLFTVSLTPTRAAATTYYVATNGNDSNPGTIDRPWLTLEKAGRTANPGDTVQVRGGVYYVGGLNFSKMGSASAPIMFRSYPGERAILDGSRSASNTTLLTISGQYYHIRGFEVRNATRTGISVWGGKYITIKKNIIHDSHRAAIYGGGGASNLKIIKNTIYNNVRENDNYEYNHRGGWAAAIITSDANDKVVNNKIYENWGEGIGAYGTNHYVANNTLHDNYSVEIYVNNVSNTTVENNFVYTNNTPAFLRNFSGVGWAAATGISIANENATTVLDNNKVLNNIVTGKRMWGLSQWGGEASVPTGLQNTIIANNTVVGYGVSGLVKIENNVHRNSTIANNIFYQTNPNKAIGQIATNSGITFRNNTWFGGSVPAKGAGAGDRNVNPKLKNIAGITPADFRLKARSQLINSGANISNVVTDYFGTRRSGTFDIGAHESTATTARNTTAGLLALPAQPTMTLLAPVKQANSITFSWSHDATAQQYRLVVVDANGVKIMKQWEDAALLCGGTNTCSKTVELPKGRYRWFVEARNASGKIRSASENIRVRAN